MTARRAAGAAALEVWAETVDRDDLVQVDTASLRRIAAIAQERERLDLQLRDAVVQARADGRSWSEIGLMLGVSKQAAQQKYGTRSPA